MRLIAEALAKTPSAPGTKWHDRIILGCWAVSVAISPYISSPTNDTFSLGPLHPTRPHPPPPLPNNAHRLLHPLLPPIPLHAAHLLQPSPRRALVPLGPSHDCRRKSSESSRVCVDGE